MQLWRIKKKMILKKSADDQKDNPVGKELIYE